MNLLHLDTSIQGDTSASRTVSAAVVERLQAADPTINVTYRDLASDPIGHLTLDAFGTPDAEKVLTEFLDADVVVIGVALYNFTIPSQLKAWIDRILIAGKTFAYGDNGPVGLMEGKRVIITLARGGIYSGDSPMAPLEHAETLLRGTLGFIGISDPEFIIAEGLALGEEPRREAMAKALAAAHHLAPSKLAA
jgi:FMN-dependent NADH-azoreductase